MNEVIIAFGSVRKLIYILLSHTRCPTRFLGVQLVHTVKLYFDPLPLMHLKIYQNFIRSWSSVVKRWLSKSQKPNTSIITNEKPEGLQYTKFVPQKYWPIGIANGHARLLREVRNQLSRFNQKYCSVQRSIKWPLKPVLAFSPRDPASPTKFLLFDMVNPLIKEQAQLLDFFRYLVSLEGVRHKYCQYFIKWISFSLPPAFVFKG